VAPEGEQGNRAKALLEGFIHQRDLYIHVGLDVDRRRQAMAAVGIEADPRFRVFRPQSASHLVGEMNHPVGGGSQLAAVVAVPVGE